MTCAACHLPTDPETVHDHEGDEFHPGCCPPCLADAIGTQDDVYHLYRIARLAVDLADTPALVVDIQARAAQRSLLARRMTGAEL